VVPQDAPIKLSCGLAAPSNHRSVVASLGQLQHSTGPISMRCGAALGGMENSPENPPIKERRRRWGVSLSQPTRPLPTGRCPSRP